MKHGGVLGQYIRDGEGQGELLLLLQDRSLHARGQVQQDTQQTNLLPDCPHVQPVHQSSGKTTYSVFLYL